MLAEQNNCCKLCERPFEQLNRRLIHVDHDHKTNELRGILCQKCNTALGSLGDTVESLERAVKYLKGEL